MTNTNTQGKTVAKAVDGGKIENCPFCGGNGDTFFKAAPHSKTGFWWNVVCNDHCLAEGPMHGTEAEAIAAWNRRASPAPSQHTGWSEEAVRSALLKHLPPLGSDAEYRVTFEGLLRALTAASSISPTVTAKDGEAWQDIATAPKDGTRILGYGIETQQVVAWEFYYPQDSVAQGTEQLGWVIYPGQVGLDFSEAELTHWQPLPTPPAKDTQP